MNIHGKVSPGFSSVGYSVFQTCFLLHKHLTKRAKKLKALVNGALQLAVSREKPENTSACPIF